MQIWMVALGVLMIAVAIYDTVTTTLAVSTAAGPVTARIGHGIWGVASRLARGPRSPLLTAAGPAIVITTIVVWMSLLWLGWWLLFSADPQAVISSSTRQQASAWDRVYFTAYTLFTLGNGDFQPVTAPWQVATGIAVANGLFTATMAITYLLPVLTAVTARRQQANTIAGLGGTAQQLLVLAWDGTSLGFLDQPLLRLTSEINRTAQRHLAYPILHFFHSATRDSEFAVGVAALDEALTMTLLAVECEAQPHPAAVGATRDAIGRLIGIVDPSLHDVSATAPPAPDLEPLRARGIPVVDDATFAQRLADEDVQLRRRRLAGLVASAAWPWHHVAAVRP